MNTQGNTPEVISDALFAVADPMMTMSGGCAGYEIIKRGTPRECWESTARRDYVIIRDDEEVAWEDGGKWTCDDESIFSANTPDQEPR